MQHGYPYPPGAPPYAYPYSNMYAPPAAAFPPPSGYVCARCGGRGADYFAPNAPFHRACAGLKSDILQWPWIVFAYLIAVPIGCTFFGAALASIPYYVWRKSYPNKARQYNLHVWIAFGLSCLMWMGFGIIVALTDT
jgi:hypothetical protein